MRNLLLAVGTDQINTAGCGEPLAVSSVYSHPEDGGAGEEVVGESAAVVAVHLNLLENEVCIGELRRVVDDKRPLICANPNLP